MGLCCSRVDSFCGCHPVVGCVPSLCCGVVAAHGLILGVSSSRVLAFVCFDLLSLPGVARLAVSLFFRLGLLYFSSHVLRLPLVYLFLMFAFPSFVSLLSVLLVLCGLLVLVWWFVILLFGVPFTGSVYVSYLLFLHVLSFSVGLDLESRCGIYCLRSHSVLSFVSFVVVLSLSAWLLYCFCGGVPLCGVCCAVCVISRCILALVFFALSLCSSLCDYGRLSIVASALGLLLGDR